MVVSQHGVSSPFLKGVTTIGNVRLTFFGDSVLSIIQKENAWLDQNAALIQSLSAGETTPAAAQKVLEAA